MSIKSDRWIRRMAEQEGMIEPFAPDQVRMDGERRLISYGTSSYGYDVRCSREFKVFTNIHSATVDPKHFDLVETGTLDTSVGTLNTVHYTLRHDDPSERSSNAWLATDHDFLMVRTEHVEDGSKTVIQLQSATVEGKPVTGLRSVSSAY